MDILVGVSGGVDSACVLNILKSQGHSVIGAMMKIYDGDIKTIANSCYGTDKKKEIKDAMEVCKMADVPFHLIDLSKEFIDNHEGGEEAENLTIYSIVNTLTELNEVASVKILINGREDQSFNDNKINFRNAFVRVEKGDSTKNDVSNNTVNNATQNNQNTNVVKNEQAIGN